MAKMLEQGEYTKTIYTLIINEKYRDAIEILENILDGNSRNRAALSLLGYCFYSLDDFFNAVLYYEQLVSLFPENNDYHLILTQCYYNCALYDAAMNISSQMDNMDPDMQNKVFQLQTAIKFCSDELASARSFVKKCRETDPDTLVLKGCLEFKEGKYSKALEYFTSALRAIGNDMQLEYNIAVTHYKLQEFDKAHSIIGLIVRNAQKNHAELAVGFLTVNCDTESVGNTSLLHQSALVEAFNLKAAMEYELGKYEGARFSLTDIPPRNENELDMITLHNMALLNMDENPAEGFDKLRFLMDQMSFPPEIFANLLILYCKYEQYDIIADLLAKYDEHKKYLTPFVLEFLEAIILKVSSTEEALKSLEALGTKITDSIRKLEKQIKDIRRVIKDQNETIKICNEYEVILESQYLPVVMAQGRIFWDVENYPAIEKILSRATEFCQETVPFKLNVAHVLFMQGDHKEAAKFYEEVVKISYDKLLSISAVVLANLCASYVLIEQTEEAELLIRRIDREEEDMMKFDPDKKLFHSCIVKMVIGTLYCTKKDCNFGMSQIVQSMVPYEKKLGPDTWYYAKVCLLHIILNAVKHRAYIKEGKVDQWIAFLNECERHGTKVKTVIEEQSPFDKNEKLPLEFGKKTVTYEARVLKHILIQLNDCYGTNFYLVG